MRKLRGFTLFELIIVIVLIGILSASLAPFIRQATNSAQQHYTMNNLLSQGRFALLRINHDIRNIRSNSTSDVSSMGANSISFNDISGTAITYNLSGSNIQRNGMNLVDTATALSFAYYDKTGAVSSSASSLCYVKVSFTLQQNSLSKTFTNTVWLRNSTC